MSAVVRKLLRIIICVTTGSLAVRGAGWEGWSMLLNPALGRIAAEDERTRTRLARLGEPRIGQTCAEIGYQHRRVAGRVTPGWDPPLNPDRDVLPRVAAESRMKPFRSLKLGEIELPRGAGSLTLRALEIPGRSVMDVRRITLTLLTQN